MLNCTSRHLILNEQLAGNPPWQGKCDALIQQPSSVHEHLRSAFGWRQLGGLSALMVILNKSEAETLQQLLNGERLWSWPNGQVQLGQSFPNLALINNLVRQGLLDQSYEPTEAGRAALQVWQTSVGLPANTTVRSSDNSPRPRVSGG